MAVMNVTKRPASSQKTQHSAAPLENLQEEIRKRAEEISKRRNGGPGDQLSDWLQAEKELKQKHNIFSLS